MAARLSNLLVLADFSQPDDTALARALLLARMHRAALHVMHHPRDDAVAPLPATLARARLAARHLEEALERPVNMVVPKPRTFDETLAAQARGADLVVVAHTRIRSLAALLHGQPTLRVLRACRTPVLVVRAGPVERYSRILVATELEPPSGRALDIAAWVEPSASLVLFHALGTRDEAKLRSAEAPEWAVQQFRERRTRQAERRLGEFVESFRHAGRPMVSIGRGDPGQQIAEHQLQLGADLVIVGKRPASPFEDFMRGSVAARVLNWSTSDVLVIPLAGAEATDPGVHPMRKGVHHAH
ncbi:universal stress protein [Ramlibacter sp.]|uniref:universal stress protein n=1 Tax=Ramlibacter sp. TaxID=1917967 RepID=UPI003D14C9CC